jgi:hypothetical protein
VYRAGASLLATAVAAMILGMALILELTQVFERFAV